MSYFTHAFKTAHTRLYTSQRVGNLGSEISIRKTPKQ